jgi:peptide-methionine (R)-S-oxide reductase
MTRRGLLRNTGLTALAGLGASLLGTRHAAAVDHFTVVHTEAEWRKLLTPEQFHILREQGTEAPESSPLDHNYKPGGYACAGCALQLFASATKFDSGTGWPSFYQPLPHAVSTEQDNSLFMERTEVHCSRCGGHLGHVFEDGPKPTGLRYCMNGAALTFTAA